MLKSQDEILLQLTEQNAQLVDFCNIVSHNLRGPLVNMSMLVQIIEETPDPLEQKAYIAKLNPVIETLNSTFHELVEAIRIKQDLDVKSEYIYLNDSLDKALDVLESQISAAHATIDVDFDEVPKVYFPPNYLYSIFYNLLSNALKYHSPLRDPVIKIKSLKQDGKVLLTIADNGLGVDLKKHKDNFFKAGKVFHRHPNAKGFGLYINKIQVEAMGGKIWVESKPNLGTTFFIELTNKK